MEKKIINNEPKLYTKHGAKRAQGQLISNKGRKALAFFEKGKIVGYSYIDEITQEAFTREVPELNLDF